MSFTEGDWFLLALMVCCVLIFLLLTHFIPKEDPGPDPDLPEEASR